MRDWTGATIGAISVSMPAQRYYRTQSTGLAIAVRSTAIELSHMVGYQSQASALRT